MADAGEPKPPTTVLVSDEREHVYVLFAVQPRKLRLWSVHRTLGRAKRAATYGASLDWQSYPDAMLWESSPSGWRIEQRRLDP